MAKKYCINPDIARKFNITPTVSDKLAYLIVLAAQKITRENNAALKPLGLTDVHAEIMFGILCLTHQQQNVSQTELTRHLELNKAMVSTVLKKLIANGYVTRTEDKKDSRVKNVTLTEKGIEALHDVVPRLREVEHRLITYRDINLHELRHALLEILDIEPSNDHCGCGNQ